MGKWGFQKMPGKGQSLIEILVGIALAAVFVIGVATVIVPSLKINTQTEQIQTRTAFATELENNIRAWAAGNWPSLLTLATGTGNYYYLNTATSSFSVITATTTTQSSSTVTETISFVQSTSTDFGITNTSGTTAYPQNVGAGDLLILATVQTQGSTLTATDTLNDTFTKISNVAMGIDNDESIFIATTSAPGADAIRAKVNGGNHLYEMSIYEYSGTNVGALANIIDASSTSSGNGKNMTTGNLTTSASGDLIFGFLSDDNNIRFNTIAYNPNYTKRELASGIVDFCNGAANCILGEDFLAASPLTAAATATLATADYWAGSGIAIKAGTLTFSGGTFGNGTSTQYVGQAINVGTTTYYRYFSLNDVYRDSNGNVTTTASGNYYDPSTKQITVIVNIASSTLPQTSYTFYLTRNTNNALSQTSWAGGAATSTSFAFVTNQFAESSNITVTATGSIQLTPGGSSCVL